MTSFNSMLFRLDMPDALVDPTNPIFWSTRNTRWKSYGIQRKISITTLPWQPPCSTQMNHVLMRIFYIPVIFT